MPSPFPGMDPYLEKNPIFHELHTQMLAEAQGLLQPQLRPKYLAKLERYLSEGSVWDQNGGAISLDRKEPDVSVTSKAAGASLEGSTAMLPVPTVSTMEEFDPDELELRKQRRIVIYVNAKPRLAVASLELLSPSNKEAGSTSQTRYLEKRASALHGGLHWIEIDLLRDGQRPPLPMPLPVNSDYLTYVAQAVPTGYKHLLYCWQLRDPIRAIPIPLLGTDYALLDLASCFATAYDRTGADEEANYAGDPPPPPLQEQDRQWAEELLRQKGLRT